MLVTLVALLCSGQVCLEKVITNSEQSSMSMMDCSVHAPDGDRRMASEWSLPDLRVESYKCVLGKYTPKNQA